MKNLPSTKQSSKVVLAKTKSLMGITNKILSKKIELVESKTSQDLTTHKDIILIGDLMWEKESIAARWDGAIEYAKNLRLGGYDDWRLPTIEELEAIVSLCDGEIVNADGSDYMEILEKNRANATYQTKHSAKGFKSSIYCSSTTYGAYVCGVDFYNGTLQYEYKTHVFYARCVRSRQ